MDVVLPDSGSIALFDAAATSWFEPLYANLEAVRCSGGDRSSAKKLLIEFHNVWLSDQYARQNERRFMAA
jgi:hypothetical protein